MKPLKSFKRGTVSFLNSEKQEPKIWASCALIIWASLFAIRLMYAIDVKNVIVWVATIIIGFITSALFGWFLRLVWEKHLS